ncbi:hypothetical protein CC78DRAFT_617449 [Lojkania enalia]|uniref:Uncharacterized protein n=1 Tax=Lojkania enalia TaxID=147567 RepID=A0A9P4K6T6_9PLEO|nr:hypothetical protein CC78DRAFT_617449 [Didymosphaeria enalia]
MFAIPSAKRIRRDQLQSPLSSLRSSPDPTLNELLRSRAHNEFTFTTDQQDSITINAHVESDGEETELRLFAPSCSTAPESHKIRISSPDATTREPGFIVKKPRSYYFTAEITSRRERELKASAISGDMIVELSKEPWPGCALPWKVRTISPAGIKKAVLVGDPKTIVRVEERVKKRRRKGKKSRIALRKKLQATKDKKAEQERMTKEKEDAEREKRTRRNREKKVKKKSRDKAKKLAEAGATGIPKNLSQQISIEASE